MNERRPSDSSAPDLAALFPSGDYRLLMRMTRGSIRDFFRQQDLTGSILDERRRWLESKPLNHCIALPEAQPLLNEWAEVAAGAGLGGTPPHPQGDEQSVMLELGRRFEPDILFLQPQDGEFRLVAGCVCFPSSWSLEEKIGRPLTGIHAPVPTLNAQLATPISQFLHRLAPGIAWCRENWGLSASPERNQHPARHTPRLSADATLDTTWLRVERQALVALPRTGGVCFGIRIESHPLSTLRADAAARDGLRRALETMPPAIAAYKGIAAARERLTQLLAG